MSPLLTVLLLALPLVPLLAAVVAATVTGDGRAGRAALIGVASAGVLALALLVAVLADGPVSAVAESGDGRAVLGLYADRLSVVMALLICGVGTVVCGFAGRYLQGDARASRFFAVTSATVAATLALVTAATLTGLVAAWVLTGAGLCALLAHRRDLPAARDGVRRARRAFLVGDLALLAATVLCLVEVGDLDLRSLGADAAALSAAGAGTWVACLVAVAALARCAQLPLPGWLPATLAAPTPVSALLHAGIVNGGGFLLVRLAPVFGLSGVATHLVFAAGAITALVATAAMLVKPDVKGALAHSTAAQMGFMLVQCAIGAFSAAIFHLVAHGMYKATLFLGSGSAVAAHARHGRAPAPASAPLPAAARAVLAALIPAVAFGIAIALVHPGALDSRGASVLLAFAWVSAAQATWGWLGHAPAQPLVAGGAALTGLLAVCVGYVALVRAEGAFLAPALAKAAPAAVSPWLLAPVALAAAALFAAHALVPRVRAVLYARALDTAHVRAVRRPPSPRRALGRPGPATVGAAAGGVA